MLTDILFALALSAGDTYEMYFYMHVMKLYPPAFLAFLFFQANVSWQMFELLVYCLF